MTDVHGDDERQSSSALQTLAGFLAAAAIFLAVFALLYRPVRMTVPAMVLALVATAIGGRFARLASFSIVAVVFGFVVGLTIQILVRHPIF